jgi:hypothetical protein
MSSLDETVPETVAPPLHHVCDMIGGVHRVVTAMRSMAMEWAFARAMVMMMFGFLDVKG